MMYGFEQGRGSDGFPNGPLGIPPYEPPRKRRRALSLIAKLVIAQLAYIGFYLGLFIWYANTVMARTYPTEYTNFFWGLLHGIFAVPSFFWSFFGYHVGIYQFPNSGGWYDFGFLLGIGAFAGALWGRAR